MKSKKILYFVAEAEYFCSHRLHIAQAAQRASYEVALLGRCTPDTQQYLEALGIKVFALKHFRRGTLNPWHQLRSLWEIYAVYRNYQPDTVHQVALKPVMYGSWMAKICGVPRVINALPGLGYLFTDSLSKDHVCRAFINKRTRWLVLKLFKSIFSAPQSTLILQNTDDQQYLIQAAALQPEKSIIIAGSGVNLDQYRVAPFPIAPPYGSSASPVYFGIRGLVNWQRRQVS